MSGARRALLAGAAAVLALGGALGLPQAVHAHALRIASTPDANAVLPTAPARVSVTFGEEPDPHVSSIQVLDTSGRDHTTGPVAAAPGDPRTLAVPVGPLPDGVFTVAWRTLSAVDGHRAAGSFAFGVGVDAGAVGTAGGGGGAVDTSPPPSVAAVAGRWVLYIGLIAVVGAAVVGGVVLPSPPRAVMRQALLGAAVAAVGTALVIGSQAADAGLGLGDLLGSAVGHAVVERVVAAATVLGLAAVALRRTGRRQSIALVATAAAAALAMLADVGNSHAAAADSWTWANITLQWVHILAAGFWIGGLLALLLSLRGTPDGHRATGVRRFSIGAGIALGLILVTGTVRAAVEIGSWGSVVGTAFGRLVLLKAALLAVLALLGAVNRYRHVPRAGRAVGGLRRIGSAELAVAAGAVFLASLLVNVAPPASSAAAAPTSAAPSPLALVAGDYATTVRVQLSVSPATPGFNTFSARVVGYDSGRDLAVQGVELSFALTQRPDIGGSTLTLRRGGDGAWTARGANLSIDGVWSVTALVENGARSEAVAFTLPTRSAQKVDVSAVAGQPTIYTVHLAGGDEVQWYLDPQTAGRDEVHATFFDATGNGYPATDGSLAALSSGRPPATLPTRELEPGHYVGDATLAAGPYRFDIVATGTDGKPVGAHIDITVGT